MDQEFFGNVEASEVDWEHDNDSTYDDLQEFVRSTTPSYRAGQRRLNSARQARTPRLRKYPKVNRKKKNSPVFDQLCISDTSTSTEFDADNSSSDITMIIEKDEETTQQPQSKMKSKKRTSSEREELSTSSEDPGPPKKKKLGRTKTGCWTCRRRKKKCDELKPECSWFKVYVTIAR
jgi:hypothetical protein